jgi:hypothetical protein
VNRDTSPGPEGKNPTREAQAETRAKSGPVRHVVKNGQDVAQLPDLDWSQQVEEIRRLNAKVLALVASDIDAGNIKPETIARLKDVSTIAKQWTRSSDTDTDLTPDERAELDARLASSQ